MKKIYFSGFVLLISLSLFSQETALDFTVTDCDNNTFNLFDELDAGHAVILEFAMVPTCQTCITAATNIQSLYDDYAALYPGMLKWFTIGYDDVYDCDDMVTWENNNGFSPTGAWVDSDDMVSYYGGMGMPTIVVLGGADHAVHYAHQVYNAQVLIDTEAAVEEILGINAIAQHEEPGVSLYPVLASSRLTISHENWSNKIVSVAIVNSNGSLVVPRSAVAIGGKVVQDISALENGLYVMVITEGSHSVKKTFQIQH